MAERLETDLSALLGPGHLITLYQPLMSLRSGRCTGFEVLSRWQHDEKGTLPPTQFVAELERSGAIAVLTRVMLAQVFEEAASFPADCTLAVNISPLQLDSTQLCHDITELSERFHFDLRRLTIEVTESAIIENLDQAQTILGSLKGLGAKLALDDFGTGYSSLTHLNALPFDEIKIDQSFVRSMGTRKDSRKIVAAVIGLGSSLGLTTVAEGVEQPAQAEMLARLGCDWAQGWLYGKALPKEAVTDFLQTSGSRSTDSSEMVDASHHDPAALCLEALPAERYALLKAIYDGAPVGLCFIDREMRFVSLNQRLAQLNRRPLEAHLGKTLQEIAPAVYEQVELVLRRAMQGEAMRDVEYKIQISPDEEPQTRMVSYQPAFDEAGEVVGVSVAVVDITARRQIEEQLRESEHHYRSMVEINPQIPWTMEPMGFATEVSPRWTEFTGQSSEEAKGWGWLDAVHPDDQPFCATVCEEADRTGEPFKVEFRVSKGDDSWHWLRSRGTPRAVNKGGTVRWYGSAECIDVEKNHERELQESVDRLQAIIDAMPIGIVIAQAPDGRIVSRNPAALRILQQDPLAFHKVSDYGSRVDYYSNGRKLHSSEFPAARALLAGVVTENLEVFCDLGDGEGKWLLLSGAPVRNAQGTIIGAVATIQERAQPMGAAAPSAETLASLRVA